MKPRRNSRIILISHSVLLYIFVGVNLIQVANGDGRKGNFPDGMICSVNRRYRGTVLKAYKDQSHHYDGTEDPRDTGEKPQTATDPDCKSFADLEKMSIIQWSLMEIN